jgi:glycosyltransferase involved in cell wall biosynthesis
MREYHNRADVNLTVSGIMQAELTRRGFERVELWPPAVDSDLFHPCRQSPAMRSRLLGGRTDRRLLLTVSRLAPEKNVGFLLNVLRGFPDACLAIVGDGPGRADLERRFQGTDTRFIGYLKGEALASAYASADAFVYASETETMGNVVLEAMASGCPVVAPRAGGIPNLLTHGSSGFLFNPGDADDAVHWTREVLGDLDTRRRISQAARQAIEARNWEHSIRCVRQSYEKAIDAPPRAARRSIWSERTARTLTTLLVTLFRTAARRGRRIATPPTVAPAAHQEELAFA